MVEACTRARTKCARVTIESGDNVLAKTRARICSFRVGTGTEVCIAKQGIQKVKVVMMLMLDSFELLYVKVFHLKCYP